MHDHNGNESMTELSNEPLEKDIRLIDAINENENMTELDNPVTALYEAMEVTDTIEVNCAAQKQTNELETSGDGQTNIDANNEPLGEEIEDLVNEMLQTEAKQRNDDLLADEEEPNDTYEPETAVHFGQVVENNIATTIEKGDDGNKEEKSDQPLYENSPHTH